MRYRSSRRGIRPLRRTLLAPLAALVALAASPGLARADDWPQWLGPARDGVWREQGIVEAFPAGGPNVRWRAPVAAGYSGPAVAGGRVIVTDRVMTPGAQRPNDPFQRQQIPGVERVHCFNEADGKPLWTHEYDCPYTISYSAGPRATPTIDGDRVYALGAEGHLHCLNVQTGKVVWAKKLGGDAPTPLWGYAAAPLVEGDKLICTTAQRGGLVTALNKATGDVLWAALDAKEPGYAPPMVYDVAGKRQLIVWHPEALNSLDPDTGKVYWTVPFGPARFAVTIVTPRLLRDEKLGDLLFVSTQYEGSLMLKLGKNAQGEPVADVLWKRSGRSDRNTDALHILMSTPVLRGGHIYGVDARGELRCLSAATGDRLWETSAATTYDAGPQNWSTAFLTPLGDRGNWFILANEHGDLILADLSPQGYREVSRTHLINPTNMDAHRPVLWCHPAYGNRSVYWRNDKELVCASLAHGSGGAGPPR